MPRSSKSIENPMEILPEYLFRQPLGRGLGTCWLTACHCNRSFAAAGAHGSGGMTLMDLRRKRTRGTTA